MVSIDAVEAIIGRCVYFFLDRIWRLLSGICERAEATKLRRDWREDRMARKWNPS